MGNYNTKIIELTNNSLELWHYSKPIYYGYSSDQGNEKKRRRKYEELSGAEKIDSYLRRKKYYKDKRHEVRRIIDLNYDNKTSFLTLTQRGTEKAVYDVKASNHEFDKFMRRLRYHLKKHYPGFSLKYLATWERTKKKVIHYHLILFDFPYVPAKKLEEIWGLGFIKINKIDEVDLENRGNYISKYFSKDLEFRDYKQKAFFKSRNLKIPYENKLFVKDSIFSTKFFGHVVYKDQYAYYPDGKTKEKVEYYRMKMKN